MGWPRPRTGYYWVIANQRGSDGSSILCISMMQDGTSGAQPVWHALLSNWPATWWTQTSLVLSASYSHFYEFATKMFRNWAMVRSEVWAIRWIAIHSWETIYPRLIAPGLATRILFLNYLIHHTTSGVTPPPTTNNINKEHHNCSS